MGVGVWGVIYPPRTSIPPAKTGWGVWQFFPTEKTCPCLIRGVVSAILGLRAGYGREEGRKKGQKYGYVICGQPLTPEF
jgi:hypothetical protein